MKRRGELYVVLTIEMLSRRMVEGVAVARSSKGGEFGFDVTVGIAEVAREEARRLNGRGNNRPVRSRTESRIDATAVTTAAGFVHISRFFRQRDQRQIPQRGVVTVLFGGDAHQRLANRSRQDRRHDADGHRRRRHRTVADVERRVAAAASALTGIWKSR